MKDPLQSVHALVYYRDDDGKELCRVCKWVTQLIPWPAVIEHYKQEHQGQVCLLLLTGRVL